MPILTPITYTFLQSKTDTDKKKRNFLIADSNYNKDWYQNFEPYKCTLKSKQQVLGLLKITQNHSKSPKITQNHIKILKIT